MRLFVLVMFFLLLYSGPVLALRCGSMLVDIGDRKHKVHRVCGEPSYVDTFDQPTSIYGYTQGYNHVDVWTYNFGPSRFMQELVFENGILRRINQLEYGY